MYGDEIELWSTGSKGGDQVENINKQKYDEITITYKDPVWLTSI